MTIQTPNAPALPKRAWTPGPWRVESGANSYFFEARIVAGDTCVAFADGEKVELANGDEEFTPSADARLIAAAPALYEALEKAEAALQAMMDAWFDYHDAHSLTQPVTGAAGNAFDKALEARDDARAALARTGEAK